MTLFHQLLVSEIPLKAYRHVFQCISLLHQIMEHADDVSIKLLDWNCEFSVISRNNQVDAKHHHGTTYIFIFLFFFLNEYSSVYVWRVFKKVNNNNITVLSFYLLVFQVRFMLKVHAFVRETSPKVLSFPKTQGRESVTCACCWIWGGGEGGMKPLLLLSGCLPFLSKLAGQICQSINGTCSLYQTVRCVWPNLSSFQSKASLARSNSQFRRTCAFHLRVGQSSWPVVANGM